MINANTALTLVGFVTSAWGAYHLTLGRSSARWPSVAGRVIRSRVTSEMVRDPHGEGLDTVTEYTADIVIEYEVSGRRYETRSLTVGENNKSLYREDVERRVAAYPVNAKVRVHYDPSNAARATLEPGKTPPAYYVALALGVLLFGLGLTGLVP